MRFFYSDRRVFIGAALAISTNGSSAVDASMARKDRIDDAGFHLLTFHFCFYSPPPIGLCDSLYRSHALFSSMHAVRLVITAGVCFCFVFFCIFSHTNTAGANKRASCQTVVVVLFCLFFLFLASCFVSTPLLLLERRLMECGAAIRTVSATPRSAGSIGSATFITSNAAWPRTKQHPILFFYIHNWVALENAYGDSWKGSIGLGSCCLTDRVSNTFLLGFLPVLERRVGWRC